MIGRLFQWLALLFTSVAIIPGGAHLAELPHKIGLDKADYLVVQQIYVGWSMFGIVLIGSLLSNLAFVLTLIKRREAYGYALTAFLLVAANLAVFFIWTFPVNQATQNWTLAPENWQALRLQWEYSHAVNATVMFTAFACLLIAVSRHPSRSAR